MGTKASAGSEPGSGDAELFGALFANAVRDAPSASFSADDVTAASARVSARRRKTTIAGCTLGVVVLVGGVVTSVAMFGHTGGERSVAAGQASLSASASTTSMRPFDAAPGETREKLRPHSGASSGADENHDLPGGSSKQGDGSTGNTGPRAGAPRPGCAKADRELATALAGELPAAPRMGPLAAKVPCPVGSRAAAYAVRDDGLTGTVSVLLLPASAPTLPQLPGASTSIATTRSGDSLLVSSTPDSPLLAAPLGAEVPKIAHALANQF